MRAFGEALLIVQMRQATLLHLIGAARQLPHVTAHVVDQRFGARPVVLPSFSELPPQPAHTESATPNATSFPMGLAYAIRANVACRAIAKRARGAPSGLPLAPSPHES